MPFSYFVVLLILRTGPEKMIDLGDKIQISYAGMTTLKDKLVRLGWVELIPFPHDRRCCFIGLTDKAKALIAEIFTEENAA